MWIQSLNLKNIRSFAEANIQFSKGINLLVGPNNTGKSTVLLPLLSIQNQLPSLSPSDIRLGTKTGEAHLVFTENNENFFGSHDSNIYISLDANKVTIRSTNNTGMNIISRISGREPNNFIYPFISKRKVTSLNEQVMDSAAEEVSSTFTNLNAKIDRLSNPEFLPAHELYMRSCNEILGFKITAAHTTTGKRAIYTVRNMVNIPLLAMGEGVTNILGLVVHLAMAENRLFLIEEPENDVHPRALKGLMDLIAEKASNNQFIITTHSNIVLKKLGGVPNTKVFRLNYSFDNRIPTSTVQEVGHTPEERRDILQDLGYEMYDLDLWDGWLILEESSSEKIIREYLIPWFASSLQNRLRTYSAHSFSEVVPKFRDFNDLFVFLHLAPVYKNRAWVLLDGGKEEQEVIETLQAMYTKSGWNENQFLQLKNHDFEDYYPQQFSNEIVEIKRLSDKQLRRQKKRELLDKVELWIQSDTVTAKAAFEASSSEVITFLKRLEQAFQRG